MNTKKITLTLSALLALTQPNHAQEWQIVGMGAAGAGALASMALGLKNGRQGNINAADVRRIEKDVRRVWEKYNDLEQKLIDEGYLQASGDQDSLSPRNPGGIQMELKALRQLMGNVPPNSDLAHQIEDLLAEISAINQRLDADFPALTREIKEIKNILKLDTQELAEAPHLRTVVEKYVGKTVVLERDFQAHKDGLAETLVATRDRIQELKEAQANLSAKGATYSKQAEVLETRFETVSKGFGTFQTTTAADIARLGAQNTDIKTEINTLSEANRAALNAAIQAEQARMEGLIADKKRTLEEEIRTAKENLRAEITTKIDEKDLALKRELTTLADQREAAFRRDVNAQVEGLDNADKMLRRELMAQIAEIQNTIAEQETALRKTLEAQVKALDNARTEQERTLIDRMNKQREELATEIGQLRADFEKIMQNLSKTFGNDITDMKADIKRLDRESKANAEAIQAFNARLAQQEEHIGHLLKTKDRGAAAAATRGHRRHNSDPDHVLTGGAAAAAASDDDDDVDVDVDVNKKDPVGGYAA